MSEYIKDKIGEHKVIKKRNGIQTKILVEPSKWYLDKQKKNAEKIQAKLKAEKIEQEKEKKIKDKMREMAIAELQKEGKI